MKIFYVEFLPSGLIKLHSTHREGTTTHQLYTEELDGRDGTEEVRLDAPAPGTTPGNTEVPDPSPETPETPDTSDTSLVAAILAARAKS